jgi:hypothetical protein
MIRDDVDIDGAEISGILFGSFARACINLGLLARSDMERVESTQPDAWCAAEVFVSFLARLGQRFRNFEPIKARIGVEMMRLWYEIGPGRAIVHSGVDFLHHQMSSAGYHSLVRGPAELVGSFSLEHLDAGQGRARVRSTSPFDRSMERGILFGGMRIAGDLVYVRVDNRTDPSLFDITFR